MSNGDQPTDLRAYAGSITRDRPVLELHAGVMAGRVVITPLSGFRGAGYRATRFEVAAHWHGPGLEGLPPAADADVTDTLLLGDLELARASSSGSPPSAQWITISQPTPSATLLWREGIAQPSSSSSPAHGRSLATIRSMRASTSSILRPSSSSLASQTLRRSTMLSWAIYFPQRQASQC
jgi:hypothetical protein